MDKKSIANADKKNLKIPIAHGEAVVLLPYGKSRKIYGKVNTTQDPAIKICHSDNMCQGSKARENFGYKYGWYQESHDLLFPKKYESIYDKLVILLKDG